MKNFSKKIQTLLMAAAVATVFTGCVKEKFDLPPINIPHFDTEGKVIKTIKELRDTYVSGTLDSIEQDWYIQGQITAEDESGNFYKTLEIQDNSAAIELKVDKSSMYTTFRRGQRIYIKLQGLYLGEYNSYLQIGSKYAGAIGRIPSPVADLHFFMDSLPGPLPAAKVLKISEFSEFDLSKLVKLENVQFVEAGSPYAVAPPPGSNPTTTSRNIKDANNNLVIMRNSSAANFSNTKMPKGIGSVTGILSRFGTTWQFTIRDLKDVVFDTTIATVQSIYENAFAASPTDWIMYSVASNKNWGWSSTYLAMLVSNYGGDVAADDWLVTPAINLTGVNNAVLTFQTWSKFADSGMPNPLEVLISTNYSGSGNPTTATWTPLAATLDNYTSTKTNSGDISLAAYHVPVRIAYHYKSSGTGTGGASQWEVLNFKVAGVK